GGGGAGGAVLGHEPDERVAVGDVAPRQRHARGDVLAGDHAQPPRIVAEVVGHRPLAVGEQSADHPRADAAERARHERRHGPERYHSRRGAPARPSRRAVPASSIIAGDVPGPSKEIARMTADRPLVVLAGPIHADGLANLEREARVVVCDDETEAGLVKVAATAQGILFRSKPRCTESLMAACT